MEAVAAGTVEWEALNAESRLRSGRRTPRSPPRSLRSSIVTDRATVLLRERGVERLNPATEIFSMSRLEERLGSTPSCNFDQWLDDRRGRPDEGADASPPWPRP